MASQPYTLNWGIISTGKIASAFFKVGGLNSTCFCGLTLVILVGYLARSKDVSLPRPGYRFALR